MHLYMGGRKKPIAITGPTGRPGNDAAPENASPQPGVRESVRRLFGRRGAWRYMNTFEGFGITVRDTPSDTSDLAIYSIPVDRALEDLHVSIYAVAVPHGMMPSVAFRIDCGTESVVFSVTSPRRLHRSSRWPRTVRCSFTISPYPRVTYRMGSCTPSLLQSVTPAAKRRKETAAVPSYAAHGDRARTIANDRSK